MIYEKLEKIKKENQPILIRYQDSLSNINQKLYWRLSCAKKTVLPIGVIIDYFFRSGVILFFKTSKISEQNRLWAAMAKETAHQIGTPLVHCWMDHLLKEKGKSEPLDEMEKDIERLQVITDRFSKVGFYQDLQISLKIKKHYNIWKNEVLT